MIIKKICVKASLKYALETKAGRAEIKRILRTTGISRENIKRYKMLSDGTDGDDTNGIGIYL